MFKNVPEVPWVWQQLTGLLCSPTSFLVKSGFCPSPWQASVNPKVHPYKHYDLHAGVCFPAHLQLATICEQKGSHLTLVFKMEKTGPLCLDSPPTFLPCPHHRCGLSLYASDTLHSNCAFQRHPWYLLCKCAGSGQHPEPCPLGKVLDAPARQGQSCLTWAFNLKSSQAAKIKNSNNNNKTL